jgi:hypothetical protein
VVFGGKARLSGLWVDDRYVAEYVEAHPDKLIGFLSVDPTQPDWQDEMHFGREELKLQGIKLLPMYAVSGRSINLKDDLSDAHYEGWSHDARYGFEQGKKMLPRVYFWDGVDRFEGPMQDIEVYWQRMDRFLSSVDLKHFAGICLAEENVNYGGRPAVLNELYRRIKAGYDTAVFQWYDNAVPSADMLADGWVTNPYYTGGQEFRQFLQRYVVTGKPVVLMPWACGQGGGERNPRFKLILEDHLRAALDYDVPVAFYWVGVRGGTSFGLSDSEPMKSINERIFKWIDHIEVLDPGYAGTPAADISRGRVLELSPQAGAETEQFVDARRPDNRRFGESAVSRRP